MVWFYLAMLGSVWFGGPFDTKEARMKSLESAQLHLIDPGFDNPPLKAIGICFQGEQASWSGKP
jgi:hypothetical protein